MGALLIRKDKIGDECELSLWQGRAKNLNPKKNELNRIRKNRTKSESKLVKYPNGFKILISREMDRTKIFWISEYI